jgi:hypothetical protein
VCLCWLIQAKVWIGEWKEGEGKGEGRVFGEPLERERNEERKGREEKEEERERREGIEGREGKEEREGREGRKGRGGRGGEERSSGEQDFFLHVHNFQVAAYNELYTSGVTRIDDPKGKIFKFINSCEDAYPR